MGEPKPAVAEQLNVYFTKSSKKPPCFVSSKNALAHTLEISVTKDVPLSDLYKYVENGERGIALLSISTKEEVAAATAFLINMRERILQRQIVVLVFLPELTDKLEELFLKLGCAEVLPFRVSPKTLIHKICRYDFNPRDVETWSFPRKPYAKRIQGHWLIELFGPGPAHGKWEKTTHGFQGYRPEAERWEWVARKLTEATPARWIFQGKKPEFDWLTNRWSFISDFPVLALVENNVIQSSVFHLDRPSKPIAPPSGESSVEFFELTEDTYDRSYVIERDAVFNEPSYRYPTGASAMRECGIYALVKHIEVELLGYSTLDKEIYLGSSGGLIEADEAIEVQVFSENLNLPENMVLNGKVDGMTEVFGTKHFQVQLKLFPESEATMKQIVTAVESRQEAIFSFFGQAKGRG